MSNEKLVNWFSGVWVKPALLAGVVIVHGLFVLPTHPYYFSYYNPLLGGGSAAARTMIVGWGEGLDEAARWLNQQPGGDQLDIVAWYSTTFEPYFEGNAIYKIDEEKISRTAKPGLAADYVIFYINQVQRELPTAGALQFFRAVPPAHTVTLNGVAYAWIYPSVNMQRVFGDEVRLVGQAELQGFTLLDPTGQPTDTLPADQPAIVQLYWEWQGKQPDEPIGLSLVDETGQQWGWGHPLGTQARFPFETWQEGMVAYDEFALAISPGTPPGSYYLKSWIDRPATGERVGDFPITADMQIAITRPTSPPAPDDLPLSARLDAPLLDGAVTLLGLEGSQQFESPWAPEIRRDLIFYWQAQQAIDRNPPLTLSLIDEAGVVRAEWTGQPGQERFPPRRWQSGDVVRDPWLFSLPLHVPPGQYRLVLHLGDDPPLELAATTVEGRPRTFTAPQPDIPIDATFGDAIQLLGLRGPAAGPSTLGFTPGQPLSFDIIWQAKDLIDIDYTVTAQLLDGEQQVLAQQDKMPLDGAAPTRSWASGEVLLDSFTLTVPPEAAAVQPSRLLIALYHVQTGQRLRLSNGADHLTIPVTLTK